MKVRCEVCNKSFKKRKDQAEKFPTHFCSVDCRDEFRRTGENKNCSTCGKAIYVPKRRVKDNNYCSRKCSGMALRKEKSVSKKKRSDAEYSEWRMEVFTRDGFTCQKCFKRRDIRAHHILSYKRYPKARYKVSNGITLCKDCHIEFHGTYTYTNFTELDLVEYLQEET